MKNSLGNRCAPTALVAGLVFVVAGTAAAQTILPMNFSFTHRLGGLIPAHQIRLEVWEQDDISADDFIGNYGTGNNGQATVLTNEDDGPFDSTLELYAFPRSWAVGYARITSRAVGSSSYFFRSPGGTGFYPATINAANGAVNLVSATNNSFGEAAFGILQPIVYTSQWFGANLGVAVPDIDVLYDGTANEPTTGFSGNFFLAGPNPRGAAPFINIDSGDWGSWDVIGHEYCHYIANQSALDPGFGGPHTIGLDNIPNGANAVQKTRATGLAWNEGIATFMYQMGVQHGNINGNFNNLLASRDFDTWYTDFNAPGTTAGDAQVTFEYDLETISYHIRNGMGVLGQHLTAAQSVGQGEGDELPVQRVLWDLFDDRGEEYTGNRFTGYYAPGRSDKVKFGHTAMWQQVLRGPDNAGNKSFQQAWDDITNYLGTAAGKGAVGLFGLASQYEAVSRVGEILEEHTISSYPSYGTTDITNPVAIPEDMDNTPELDWFEQANGRTDLHRVLVFSNIWDIVYDSGNILDTDADVAGYYTHEVASPLANGLYYWVVLNNPDVLTAANLRDDIVGMVPNQADLFKYYWSGANAFRIIPTPGTLALLTLSGLAVARRRRSA